VARFRVFLAAFCIVAVCGVLLGAFWQQYGKGEFPCPLCILQRMGMILCALGPAWLLCRAARGPVDAHDYAQCYGLSVLGAILGGAISLRQVLLHIAPGDPGYGDAVLGLHLYTWAFVVFVTVVAASGIQLLFLPRSAEAARPGVVGYGAVLLLGAIIAANAVAVFVESGLHWYLPDNPTSERLFDEPPFADSGEASRSDATPRATTQP
jgi:disulfide bond formation protein DsbB